MEDMKRYDPEESNYATVIKSGKSSELIDGREPCTECKGTMKGMRKGALVCSKPCSTARNSRLRSKRKSEKAIKNAEKFKKEFETYLESDKLFLDLVIFETYKQHIEYKHPIHFRLVWERSVAWRPGIRIDNNWMKSCREMVEEQDPHIRKMINHKKAKITT